MPTKEQIIAHNFHRSMRRQAERQNMKQELYRTPIRHHPDHYFDHLISTHVQVNLALELWFEIPLFCAEQSKAARVLYNDIEGPLIHLSKGRYGTSEAKRTISHLRNVESLLLEADNSHLRQRAYEILSALPFPQNLRFQVEFVRRAKLGNLASDIKIVANTLESQLSEQPKGNARAEVVLIFRTGLRLS